MENNQSNEKKEIGSENTIRREDNQRIHEHSIFSGKNSAFKQYKKEEAPKLISQGAAAIQKAPSTYKSKPRAAKKISNYMEIENESSYHNEDMSDGQSIFTLSEFIESNGRQISDSFSSENSSFCDSSSMLSESEKNFWCPQNLQNPCVYQGIPNISRTIVLVSPEYCTRNAPHKQYFLRKRNKVNYVQSSEEQIEQSQQEDKVLSNISRRDPIILDIFQSSNISYSRPFDHSHQPKLNKNGEKPFCTLIKKQVTTQKKTFQNNSIELSSSYQTKKELNSNQNFDVKEKFLNEISVFVRELSQLKQNSYLNVSRVLQILEQMEERKNNLIMQNPSYINLIQLADADANYRWAKSVKDNISIQRN